MKSADKQAVGARALGGMVSALAIAAAIGAMGSQPVFAQTAPAQAAEDNVGLDEIVVTAQRREENVQDTPLSVTAVSADDLRRTSTSTLTDLQVPSLVVGGKLTGGGNQPITLRGVTGQTVLTGLDSAVSVYLDGVYLPKPDSAFFSLADVERIEVLRGPQGTLYGRNATGGAINIVTRVPGDELSGIFDVSYGEYGSYEGRAYLGIPLANGLSASVSLMATGNDGYFSNSIAPFEDLNSVDSLTGRVKLRYESEGGAFDATLSYDRTEEDADIAYFHYGFGPIGSPTYVGVSNPDQTFSTWSNFNYSEVVSQGYSLLMNYRPNEFWTITSVTGLRELDVHSGYSITPPGGFPVIAPNMIQSLNDSNYGPAITQELRAVYDGDTVKFTTGVSYFHDEVWSHFGGAVRPFDQPAANLDTIATAPVVETETTSYGVFAQLDWEFMPRWTASIGARGNREERSMHETFTAVVGQPTLDSNVEDDHLIPKVGLSYRPTDDLMIYASVSQGYQAPGQSYSTNPVVPILEVDPEELTSYEIGVRSDWLDGRLRVNATAFHYQYDPLQVRVTVGLNQFNIVNAAAEVDGFEFEVAGRVTSDLTLFANGTLLNSEYTDFCDSPIALDAPSNCRLPGTGVGPNNGVSRVGNPLNQAPELQYTVGFNYEHPLPLGTTFNLDGSYSFIDEFFSAPAALDPYLKTDSLGRLNLRAALSLDNGIEFYAFGRNLTNDQSQGSVLYTGLLGGILDVGQITAPRVIGAGVRYSF